MICRQLQKAIKTLLLQFVVFFYVSAGKQSFINNWYLRFLKFILVEKF